MHFPGTSLHSSVSGKYKNMEEITLKTNEGRVCEKCGHFVRYAIEWIEDENGEYDIEVERNHDPECYE